MHKWFIAKPVLNAAWCIFDISLMYSIYIMYKACSRKISPTKLPAELVYIKLGLNALLLSDLHVIQYIYIYILYYIILYYTPWLARKLSFTTVDWYYNCIIYILLLLVETLVVSLSAAACQVRMTHSSSTRSDVQKQVPTMLLVLAVFPCVSCTFA